MKDIIPAPKWLTDRMELMNNRPPPSIERVRAQWAASARQLEEMYQPEHEKIRSKRKIEVIR